MENQGENLISLSHKASLNMCYRGTLVIRIECLELYLRRIMECERTQVHHSNLFGSIWLSSWLANSPALSGLTLQGWQTEWILTISTNTKCSE